MEAEPRTFSFKYLELEGLLLGYESNRFSEKVISNCNKKGLFELWFQILSSTLIHSPGLPSLMEKWSLRGQETPWLQVLRQRNDKHGFVAICNGGGGGASALVLELIPKCLLFAFVVLAAGAIIFTLNVLLGGYIFQSLNLLSYCLFPLDVGALIYLLIDNAIVRLVVVAITLAWRS